DRLLLLHQGDDRILAIRVELQAVRVRQAELVAGVLNDGDLKAEAEPEVRDAALAGESHGGDLAFDAAVAEAAGDEDAVEVADGVEALRRLERLRVDAADLHRAIVGDARVGERLVDGFIGVLQLDVFADDADLDALR